MPPGRSLSVAAAQPRDRVVVSGTIGDHGMAIMSVLAATGEESFSSLRDMLKMTDGNLMAHLRTLQEAGYVAVTKVFEETRTGTLPELAGYYGDAPPRGEVTVVVSGGGRTPRETPPPDPQERARALLSQGLTRKNVADQLAEETGISRNAAYRLVNEL